MPRTFFFFYNDTSLRHFIHLSFM